jgi:Tol biopolymer transport system component
VIGSTRIEMNPDVSPDGRHLAFSSNQTGYAEIWVSDFDGKEAVPITSMKNANTGSPAWSPDGARIAFDSRADGHPQIYLVDAGGGKVVRLTAKEAWAVVPRWSPDAKWIYYTEVHGPPEIWRVPATGGVPEQITRAGGFAAVPSPNGKYLYYNADRGAASPLFELELVTRQSRMIAPSAVNRGFAATSEGLYFLSGSLNTEDHSLFLLDRQSGKPRLLFRLQHGVDRGISMSTDDHSLYYTGIDRAGHELLIVDRFWR